MSEAKEERIDWYILFFNHTDGMQMYRYLKDLALPVRISPAPRAATVCCGMSLLVTEEHIAAVRQAVEDSGIAYDRIVDLPRQINPHRDVYC
ncbi:MAG: DUF3343 domain-containing protein [Firmicutes bacterium]|nr:DUF3343 domain-containing protein [Bacillota bacterium]